MSMNDTPSGERVHIGFFGRRNVGKSSLVNAFTGQEMSVVSDVRGTTTDPVTKSMELLPIGPVLIIDTPGFDDTGDLGLLRVRRTRQTLNRTDLAILVTEAGKPLEEADRQLLSLFAEKKIPHLIVLNKADLLEEEKRTGAEAEGHPFAYVSALTGEGVIALRERAGSMKGAEEVLPPLASDLVPPGGLALLVIPIDKAAPKGRLILPQQQVIRDLLDAGRTAACVRETELEALLKTPGFHPDLVITDSQVFRRVSEIVPEDLPLTSFSILMARRKGFLEAAVAGCRAIEGLREGDRILVSEGCTHHRQCGDIGTVKIPAWLRGRTGKDLDLTFSSGKSFPEDLAGFAAVIHCGGCMLNAREMRYRMQCALDQGVPFINYGTFIAYVNGILERSVRPIPGFSDREGKE